MVLPHITHVDSPEHLASPRWHRLAGEPGTRLLFKRPEDRVDVPGRHVAGSHDPRGRELRPEIRYEEPECGEDARVLGHEHGRDAESARELGRVQRAGPAEGDQGEPARVVTPLDGDPSDGPEHGRVDHGQDAEAGLHRVHAKGLAHVLQDRALGGAGGDRHGSGEQAAGAQPPGHDVGVGDGRLLAAEVVARRPRHGPRALGPHLDEGSGVHAGDAPAARTDRVNVDHGLLDVVASDPPNPAQGHLPIPHQRHVGAGAPHVEGDDVGMPGLAGHRDGAHDAGGGARQQQRDGQSLGLLEGHDAAVGPHDARGGRQP